MPKGIPNEKAVDSKIKLVIVLNEADYLKLVKLAADQYRTPQLQAGYLLNQVLSQVNGGDAVAARILTRAHSRENGEGA